MVFQHLGEKSQEYSSIGGKSCKNLAVTALDKHLLIPVRGSLNMKKIFETTVGMATNRESIYSITNSLKEIPCETSIRYHLAKISLPVLEGHNVGILTANYQKVLKRDRYYRFAIDFTLDPYYGKAHPVNLEYIIHNKQKKSTNDFYGYATLCCINRNRHLTLSILPVRPDRSTTYYIAVFLDVIRSLNLST